MDWYKIVGNDGAPRGAHCFIHPLFFFNPMATLLYNTPALRPGRAFNTVLTEMLREALPAQARPAASFQPSADILETAQGYEVLLALPGVAKEAVKIEFLDGQLVVSGERPHPLYAGREAAASATEADKTSDANAHAHTAVVVSEAPARPQVHRLETNYGTFRRSFGLPDTVNVKAIDAALTDGVLRLTLPFDTDKVTRQTIAVR